MHLVNVNVKNYLQRKCFITDTAGTKGSIGRGFPPFIYQKPEAEEKPLFKEDFEALRDATKGIEDKSVIDNINVIYLYFEL